MKKHPLCNMIAKLQSKRIEIKEVTTSHMKWFSRETNFLIESSGGKL